ncbi:MAG: ABC transporter ATP-binding protein [Acidobacteria bacterium]|nr:ABC transporter ATP-binding protein [Acidobacteriota bacterium]
MSGEEKSKKKFEWTDVWPEVRDLVWRYRKRMALGFVLLIISHTAGMVLPASTKFLIDDVIGQGKVEYLKWIAVAAIGATMINAATSFTLTVMLGVAGQRAIVDLRRRVQRHIGRLPVSYYEDHKSGEMISRIMTDAEGVRNLVGTGFVQMIGGIFSAVIALGVLLWLNWRLTSLTLVCLAGFGAVMVVGFSRIRPIFRERGKIQAEVTGRLTESLGGIRVIKAYTAEKREERIFTAGVHRLLRNVAKSMVGVAGITSISTLIFGIVGVVMSIVGAYEVLAGRMTVGEIFMFVMFTGLLVRPLVQMSNIGTQFTEAFAGLDRIREVLSEQAETEISGAVALEQVRGHIIFEKVDFEYNEDRPVLKNVSFDAPAGTTTALVGSSGAGKSTVISLVMGFRHPQEGRVTVDGHDLSDVRMHDYRRRIAVVLQDDFLFDGTIGENIAFGRPGARREDIEEAGRLARCDEFITGFDEGYDTIIGERGVKLSGGQRQRVSIARATLADPSILILDEATSSLDSENEAAIQEGFKRLKQGRTTFVIAHRLSTIRNADQILVMEHGEIVERGTHHELLAAAGRYRELYEKQHHLEMDQFINPGEDFTLESVKDVVPSPQPATGGGLPRD